MDSCNLYGKCILASSNRFPSLVYINTEFVQVNVSWYFQLASADSIFNLDRNMKEWIHFWENSILYSSIMKYGMIFQIVNQLWGKNILNIREV